MSTLPIPDGIYSGSNIQVKNDDSRAQILGSIISPYRPAHPTFQLVDNGWNVGMTIPEGYTITVGNDSYTGNSYHRVNFYIDIIPQLTVILEDESGLMSSTNIYSLPVSRDVTVTLDDDDVPQVTIDDSDNVQYSIDGGLTWSDTDTSFTLETGTYSDGSVLIREVVRNDEYEAYGPVVGLGALFSPYRIIHGIANYSPRSSEYVVTGVGPVGSAVQYIGSSGQVEEEVIGPSGQFEVITPIITGAQSVGITLTNGTLTSATTIPVRTIHTSASQLIMGYVWHSITAHSSNSRNAILTITNLTPNTAYTLNHITSYSLEDPTRTATVNIDASITSDSRGWATYYTAPDNGSDLHPYIELLIGAGIMENQSSSTDINDGVVIFEVSLGGSDNIVSSTPIAYYKP